jgi:two-component system, OmpR family, response regulator MprA
MSTGHPRVLVAEDDPGVASFLRRGLKFEGYDVEVAGDGASALDSVWKTSPDFLILDVMIPVIDGFGVARRIREVELQQGLEPMPILMLTAKDAVSDRVAGLDAGADDYLVKPFSLDELLARLRALQRRRRSVSETSAPAMLSYADLSLDPATRIATRGERTLELTAREFELLSLFIRNANIVLSRSQIMDRIWGDRYWGDSNVLEVFIGSLRRSMEASGETRLIQTVRGVGYVLRGPERK